MANRYFNQFLFSFRKKLTFLEANFVVDATGGATAASIKGAGVIAINKTGTGLYRISFADKYKRYLGSFVELNDTTGSIGTSGIAEIQTVGDCQEAVQANHAGDVPYIDIQMRAAGGAAADPTAATTVRACFFMDNTTVLSKGE